MAERSRTFILGRWALILPALLVGAIAASTAGFCVIEGLSVADGLYYTLLTVSTVGFEPPPDMSATGQWWTMGVIVVGIGLAAATLTVSIAALTEGTLRQVLGRRHVQRAIEQLQGHTVICGFGRMGTMVAAGLADKGRGVVVVDRREELLNPLDHDQLLYVVGDAQEESVLAAAGVERAAHVVLCLPTDADNVFLTLTVRQMNASATIVARAEHPSTQSKLLRAGADRVGLPADHRGDADRRRDRPPGGGGLLRDGQQRRGSGDGSVGGRPAERVGQ